MIALSTNRFFGLLSLILLLITSPLRADEAVAVEEVRPAVAAAQVIQQPANPALQAKRRGLETIVKVELSFLNRVVDLTDKQRGDIVAAGKSFIESEMKDARENGGAQIRQVNRRGVHSFDAERRDLEASLRKRIHKLLEDKQWEAYSVEIEDRKQFQQQVVIDCFVSALDNRLNMDKGQRIAVAQVFRDEYGDQLPDLQTALNYGRYLPAFDLQKMEKCLNEDQRKILNSIQRVTYGSGNTFANDRNFIVDDIDLEP